MRPKSALFYINDLADLMDDLINKIEQESASDFIKFHITLIRKHVANDQKFLLNALNHQHLMCLIKDTEYKLRNI